MVTRRNSAADSWLVDPSRGMPSGLLPTRMPVNSTTKRQAVGSLLTCWIQTILAEQNMLEMVISHTTPDDWFFAALVCTAFRDAIRDMIGRSNSKLHRLLPERPRMRTPNSAVVSSLSRFMWVVRWERCPWVMCWDARTTWRIAWHGKLDILQWCVERGCAMDQSCCAQAAQAGHLHVLQVGSTTASVCVVKSCFSPHFSQVMFLAPAMWISNVNSVAVVRRERLCLGR